MKGFKYFGIDIESVIDVYEIDEYFKTRPDEQKEFWESAHKQKIYKNCDIFTGKKTDPFDRFLKALSIKVDIVELEIDYYYYERNFGELYKYTNGKYTLYIDFCVDPTLQIECCYIALEYPKQEEKRIAEIITDLYKSGKYTSSDIIPCMKKDFIKRHKQTKKQWRKL